jgi:hypothetical protein
MTQRQKTGGRQAGTPNHITSESRVLLVGLVEGNIAKLHEWLDSVASGIWKIDPVTGLETGEYLVKPSPEKAFQLLQSLLEFYVPKLTRMQVSGSDLDPSVVRTNLGVFGELIKEIKLHRQA